MQKTVLIQSLAGAVFADSLLRALGGEKGIIVRSFHQNDRLDLILIPICTQEPSYVRSPLFEAQGVTYFASNIELGTNGVEKILPLGKISPEEEKLLDACLPDLAKNIKAGEAFMGKA